MSLQPPSIRLGLLVLGAWLLVALPPVSIQRWLPPNRFEFFLPRVCVPYTPGADFVSVPADLFSALAVVVLSILLVEMTKLTLAAQPGRRVLLYFALSVYQATLAIDALRRYALDWYGYLLYFARLITLSYDRPHPEVLPIPSPWMSLAALLACSGLYVFDLRGQRAS